MIVGFTGETILCESVLSSLKELSLFKESSLWTVETVSSQVKWHLGSLNLKSPLKCSFTITGINAYGQIELDTIGISSGLQITQENPTTEDLAYATLSPDNVNGDKIFIKNLTSRSWQSIKEPMISSIAEVAKLDSSVNTHCFFQQICLQKY